MHARRPHDIALPCAKLQAVTRLSQNRNMEKIIYMMHDGWHSHYLPYLSSGQQAVTGSLAVSLGSRALQSPSRQRFADFTCVLLDGKMGGFPFCPLHHCIFLFTLASNFFRLQRAKTTFQTRLCERATLAFESLRNIATHHATLSISPHLSQSKGASMDMALRSLVGCILGPPHAFSSASALAVPRRTDRTLEESEASLV